MAHSAKDDPSLHNGGLEKTKGIESMRWIVILAMVALLGCAQQQNTAIDSVAEGKVDFTPIPYDPESGVVAINSPQELFGLFKAKVNGKPVKGEYETTEQFESRANDVAAILTPIDVGVTYLIPTRTSNFVYDADAQLFNLEMHSSRVSCLYDYTLKTNVCWFATLVKGKTGGDDYKLAIGSEQSEALSMKNGMGFLPHRCLVPIDQAPEMKEYLRMAYGVQFDSPVVHYGENRIFNPDLTSPVGNKYFSSVIMPVRLTHMVCFDERDGSVVYQEEF